MLPLLKKRSNSPAAPAVPAWHPNFRDYEKLPDVKVVRTAFFVNGAAILVLLLLAAYFGLHEWQLHAINGQIADWQRQIDRDKRPSEQAVGLYKKFQAEQAKATEVDTFVKSRPALSDLLLRLAQTLPENIALDAVEMRSNGIGLRLSVRGSPEVAAGYATSYLDQLRADKQLTGFDHSKFQFTNQARNASTGRLAVEFFLEFTPEIGGKH